MNKRYFNICKRLAMKSDHHSHQLGCVVVKKNRPIGFGWNSLKTHSKSPSDYKSIHAEFHAILGLNPADLCGAEIYVYRQNKKGEPANAKPCKNCHQMLQYLKIKKVCYSINGKFVSETIS